MSVGSVRSQIGAWLSSPIIHSGSAETRPRYRGSKQYSSLSRGIATCPSVTTDPESWNSQCLRVCKIVALTGCVEKINDAVFLGHYLTCEPKSRTAIYGSCHCVRYFSSA